MINAGCAALGLVKAAFDKMLADCEPALAQLHIELGKTEVAEPERFSVEISE